MDKHILLSMNSWTMPNETNFHSTINTVKSVEASKTGASMKLVDLCFPLSFISSTLTGTNTVFSRD